MREVLRLTALFPSVNKKRVALLLLITFLATLFEGFGVAMLYPVMDFIEKGQSPAALAASSRMWSHLVHAYEVLSVPLNLLSLLLTVFSLFMLRQWFNYLKDIYSRWISEGILDDIRHYGFQWLVDADLAFYDRHNVGELINLLIVDGQRAGNGVYVFFEFLAASLIFLFYYIFLMVLSPWMTLVSVAVMIGVGFMVRGLNRKSQGLGEELSEHNDRISSAMVERLSGIRLLKLAASEKREVAHLRNLSRQIKMSTYDLGRIRARIQFVIDPLVVLSGLAILYFSVGVLGMTLAKIAVFMFVMLRITPYAKEVFTKLQSLAGYYGSMIRVIQLLQEAREAHRITGGEVKEITLEKGIEIKKLNFRYASGEQAVLKDVETRIPAGKMTAVVGPSGAGKSTLASLIPRLREPESGIIAMDGRPLESFDLTALRRSVGFVSQSGFLFDDTIRNNIKYCRPEASDEEMIQAARLAYADPFIGALPEGYDTRAGDRGVRLSGGQQQRIVLARALLQNARIIILDEPTSALDSESEEYIQKALEDLRGKGTITFVVIAHRLSTVRGADRVIVFDGGRIVEQGAHEELLRRGGWYAEMIQKQALL